MKQTILALSLLISQHLAIASCDPAAIMQWKMHVTNNTSGTITLSCGGSIPSKSTGNGSGTTGNGCGAVSGSECTYTDAGGKTGTLSLTYNSCSDITSDANTSSTSTIPIKCPFGPTSNLTGSTFTMCDKTRQVLYSSYSVESYFTIIPNIEYVLEWKSVLTNLTKGQKVASQLAKHLMQTGIFTNTTAIYNGSSIKVTLTATPDDPYLNASSCS